MNKPLNYAKYLDEKTCRLIRVMDVEMIISELCDYYESTLDPDIIRLTIPVYLMYACIKILHANKKIRGDYE